jgi:hypothetical protein
MAEVKTKLTKASVEKFLKSIKDSQKREDCIAICNLMEKVTKWKPEMWGEAGVGPRRKDGDATASSRGRANFQQKIMRDRSIVGFGRRTYTYASGKIGEWMVIGFAPRAANIAL